MARTSHGNKSRKHVIDYSDRLIAKTIIFSVFSPKKTNNLNALNDYDAFDPFRPSAIGPLNVSAARG